MKALFSDDFLLTSDAAKSIYEKIKKLPVIDTFTALSAKDLAEDVPYTNVYELLFGRNTYANSLFRCAGVPEKFITGRFSDYEKFREICAVFPDLIGSDFYIETHFLLNKFGVKKFISSETCDEIWRDTADVLFSERISPASILRDMNAELIGISADPLDSADFYKIVKNESQINTEIRPVISPDRIFSAPKRGFRAYIKELENTVSMKITDLSSLQNAYRLTFDKFEDLSCISAYHSLDEYEFLKKPDHYHAGLVFDELFSSDGQFYDREKLSVFRSELLKFFFTEYKKRGWRLELNVGNKAKNSDVSLLFDHISEKTEIPDLTIRGNASVFMSLCEKNRGNIRFGFNKNYTFDLTPAIGRSVGFSSGVTSAVYLLKHEIFRRKLASHIAKFTAEGLLPDENEAIRIAKNITYNNIKHFYGDKV